ncbi:hypothetical protein T11_11289 [Trichinella zimbabwensis]|uniref:Transcription factor CBF/NF-Y/archaeal histone domain-containing protein n=1 Tax=Trichinella zimbabwensis TaxID=268475 RepID=A0A0V1HHF1_9BILA|nr:hypothetical protein T11_11289 [Trichinella zimbabwensis]
MDLHLSVKKIKRLMKADPAVNNVTTQAAEAMAMAAQYFCVDLAKKLCGIANGYKRKTVRKEDFDTCIKCYPSLKFIGDAIDTFPTQELCSIFDDENSKPGEEETSDSDGIDSDEPVEKKLRSDIEDNNEQPEVEIVEENETKLTSASEIVVEEQKKNNNDADESLA